MLSFTGLLQEELEEKVNEDLRTSFHIIQSAGKRLIRTVDMLLNMSEVHTGAYEYQPREIDLYSDILERIYNEYYNTAKNKNLEFLIENKASDTKLVADEYSVYQIFTNLVDNAIKYTNTGKVTCCIKRDNRNRLIVEVQDTGIGISTEYLPNLFLPFSQEEQGYTRKFEGNGLGMALVKSYCDINNAVIAVKSEKDMGTVFTVTFPEQTE
jgi:signal transduction histidine kinase